MSPNGVDGVDKLFLPGGTSFRGFASPCSSVRCVKEDGERLIEWEPGAERVPMSTLLGRLPIKDQLKYGMIDAKVQRNVPLTNTRLVDRFIMDSWRLGNVIYLMRLNSDDLMAELDFSNEFISKFNSDPLTTPDHPLLRYWQRWGPLFPSKNNKVALAKVYDTLMIGHILASMWDLTIRENGKPASLSVLEAFIFGMMAEGPEGTEIPSYLQPGSAPGATETFPYLEYVYDGDMGCQRLMPAQKRNLSPWLYIKPPSKLVSRDDEIEWFRSVVIDNIGFYLSKQPVTYTPVLTKKGLTMMGQTNNLFLFWMLSVICHQVPELTLCTCGNVCPPGRTKHCSAKCANEAKNSTLRKLRDPFRKLRQRELLSKDNYQRVLEQIREMLKTGKEEFEITKALDQVRVDFGLQPARQRGRYS